LSFSLISIFHYHIYLYICLSIHKSIYLSIISINPYVYLFHLSIYKSFHLYIYRSILICFRRNKFDAGKYDEIDCSYIRQGYPTGEVMLYELLYLFTTYLSVYLLIFLFISLSDMSVIIIIIIWNVIYYYHYHHHHDRTIMVIFTLADIPGYLKYKKSQEPSIISSILNLFK